MEVIHLISGGDTGGAKTHVLSLVNSLRDKVSVRLICLTPGDFYHEAKQSGLPVSLLEQKQRWDLSIVSELTGELAGADILHCHGARANFLAALVKRHVEIPILTTLHSDYLRDFEDNLYKHLTYTPLNCLSLRKMDYHVAVTETFRQMLIERNFKSENIFTVYNGIDFSCVPNPETPIEEFRTRWDIPSEAPLILSVGRLARIKRQDVLLKAAARLEDKHPDAHYLIVGDGPQENSLHSLSERLKISDKVHFTGYLEDVESALCAADIAVLTSESESFPYALLEAARRKMAVVSTPVGGIPEMIIDSETGITTAVGDHGELVQALTDLLKSTELRENLGNRLYEHTRKNFSLEAMLDRHLTIYRTVLPAAEKQNQRPQSGNAVRVQKKASDDVSQIVISGYFGFGNTGDEALLEGMITSLTADDDDNIQITVLSADPQETTRMHGVNAVNRFAPWKVLKTLRKAELFLSGGGTLLQDETSLRSFLYYAGLIKMASILNTRVMLYANGLGPLNTQTSRSITRHCLDLADAVTFRDHQSLQAAQSLYHQRTIPEKFEVTADPAFCLQSAPKEAVIECLRSCGVPNGVDIAVMSVRPWRESTEKVAYAMGKTAQAVQDKGFFPLFLPMQPHVDTQVCMQAKKYAPQESAIVSAPIRPQLVLGIMEQAELTVAMRLHALILSAAAKVPMVGLSYDPKIDGFLSEIGAPSAGRVENITAENLISTVCHQAIPQLNDIKQQVEKRADKMKIQAQKNTNMALSVLEKNLQTKN